MDEKVDINIVKYYQSCLTSYERASGDDKYEEALKAVVSLNKNGIKVCYHASICIIMERFVNEFPTPEIIGSLFRALNTYLDGVIIGKNTSRLLEKVLLACQKKEISDDDVVQFQSKKFCDYMWIHYPDNLENNISSHIVRLFFQFVCGVYVQREDKVYSSKDIIVSTPMQEDYTEKLDDLVKRFLLNPHVQQLLTNEYMSSTLQILLVICSVRSRDKFKEVIKHLLSVLCNIDGKQSDEDLKDIQIPSSFLDKYQSFFLECFLLMLPKGKQWKRFSHKYLDLGKDTFISEALTNSHSCGLLKAAIARSKELDVLLAIAQQLKLSLAQSPTTEIGNIFLKLLIMLVDKIPLFADNGPHKLRFYKQAIIEIVQLLSATDGKTFSLMKLLNNGLKREHEEKEEEEEENNDDEDEEEKPQQPEKICSLWASMLLQAVLHGLQPVPSSINKLFTTAPAADVVRLASDAKASRVMDAFFTAAGVPDEVKQRLLDGLQAEQLAEIACSTFGSRVMDKLWASGNAPLIALVKGKLQTERMRLKSHRIGKFVESKFFGYVPKVKEKKGNNVNKQNQPPGRPIGGGNNKRLQQPTGEGEPKQKKMKNENK